MKRFWKRLILPLLISSALNNFVQAQVTGGNPLPTQQQLSHLSLERAWWSHAVINPQRDKVEHVTVDEDLVYVQATSGVMTAFDAENGRQIWSVQVGRFDQPSFAATSNEDEVLTVNGGSMYGIDKATGRVLWNLVLPGQPSTGPSVDDDQVYFGTLDGSVYAYDLKKIHKLYEERRLPKWSGQAQVWKSKAAKEITSPPMPVGRFVYFASRDASLYSVAKSNRKLIYQFETDGPIVAPLARSGDTLFVASDDNNFMALMLTSGKVKWEFTSGLPIRKPIRAIGQDLYVFPQRGGMYSLDPASGNQRWSQPDLSEFVAIMGDTVATTDVDGNIVLVNRAKGEILGSMPLRRFSVRVGNERTDRIYMATESGVVMCLRQIGHNFPVFHQYPDRLPLLPEFAPEDGQEEPSATKDESEAGS
ncbi:outer membrane protein assembly factor BamB family protein [Schlesneria paludicola]|uniref:outer membrane protein assembly factor BamB family protein n=1 Tax=Schlesneria paludicola TaxID=360056 RepID=UPI00029AE86D|nr:PQQ-binding-like beta-propeller repeat protein [Schlesneria paludicola]